MQRLILALVFLLTACGVQQPALVEVAEASSACQTLYIFDDGQTLQLCESSLKVTPVPPAATDTPAPTETALPTNTSTAVPTEIGPTDTASPEPSATGTATQASTDTQTPPPPSATPAALVAPYPGAPLCAPVGEQVFHTLWNSTLGCHYDHEHGMDPFTPAVAATFPGFDLYALLGGVQVGHTNPSSPMENTHKHGGMKWDVTLTHSAGCETGPGAGNITGTGVDAFVAQYHNFGDYSIEFETRVHTAVGLLRQCRASNPTDYGYVFVNQFQDYGQRVIPYQGTVYPYPDNPAPYNPTLSPYFTIDCFGPVIQCRASRQYVLDRNANASSTWASEPRPRLTGLVSGSPLFSIVFRLRDNYQLIDWADQTYPFTFAWLCSSDGGVTYNGLMPNCRWNNTTSRIHEVHGIIPAAWDNVAGFDTDPRTGRITAEGYVTHTGELNTGCAAPALDCHPLKLVSAFVGPYASAFGLVAGKGSFTPENLPERDIYFCGSIVCTETTPGAVPSGWISENN
jgi:hypothetical protein